MVLGRLKDHFGFVHIWSKKPLKLCHNLFKGFHNWCYADVHVVDVLRLNEATVFSVVYLGFQNI